MAYKDVILGDGPVAYWRLGERFGTNAVDQIGPHGGTMSGALTLGLTSPLADPKDSDTAIGALAAGPSITASSTTWAPGGTNAWSIETWFQPTVLDASFRRIAGTEPVNNHGVFLYYQNGVGFGVARGDSGATVDVATGGSPQVGVWAHLLGTYDGVTLRLYVNGSLVMATNSSRSVDAGSISYWIVGGTAIATGQVGIWDEEAVYSKALSGAQANAHYQAGRANFLLPEGAAACSFHVTDTTGTYQLTLRGVLGDPVFSSKLNEGFAALHLEFDHYPTELAYGNLVRVDFPDGTVAGIWKMEQRNAAYKASEAKYSLDLVPLVAEASDVDFNANYTADTTQPNTSLGVVDPSVWSSAAIVRTVHLNVGVVLSVGTSYGYAFNNAVVRDALDQHVHYGGAGWFWMVHETGTTDVRNTTAFAHTVTLGREISETNFEENIHAAINVQPVVGATPASGTVALGFTASDTNPANPLSVPKLGRRVAKVFTDTSLVTIGDVTAMANSLLAQQERVSYRRTYRLLGYTAHRVRCGDSIKIRIPNLDPTTGGYAVLGPLVVQEVVQYGATNTYDVVCTDTAIIFNQRAQESRTNAIDKLIQNNRSQAFSPDGTTGSISAGAISGGSPNTPTGLALSTFIENTAQVENAAVTATWSASVVDATHAAPGNYILRYRRSGTTPWQIAGGVVAGTLTGTVTQLVQGISYDFQVAAANAGGTSPFSATVTQVTAQATAPAQVAQPTATLAVTTVVIAFNLLVASDIQTYEIWQFTGASTASTPPGGSVLAHTGNDAIVAISGLTTNQTYTFWVRAENWSGLFGSYSPYVQAIPNPATAFDVTQAVLSASEIANPGFEDTTPGGTLPAKWGGSIAGSGSLPVRGTGQQLTGAAELDMTSTAGVGNYSRAYSQTVPVSPGDIWYFSCQAKASVATTNGFYFRISWGTTINDTSDGTAADIAAGVALTTSYQKFEGKVTVPAAMTYMHVVFYNYQPNVGNTTYVDDVIASRSIGTAMIQNLAVTNAVIANLAVTNAKINDMAVDKLTTGTLTAGVIMAGNIKSAATVDSTHAGWFTDATSIRMYDGSGTNYESVVGYSGSGAGVTVELKNDGTAFFKGTISASSIYAGTIATSTSVGTTGNPGYKLTGQHLDYFTQGATIQSDRWYYAPDGSTAFSLAGEMAAASATTAGAADGDSGTCTSTINRASAAIVSFSPSGTPALVKKGTFATTDTASIAPTFGQATTSGNLLVACVTAYAGGGLSSVISLASGSGWIRAAATHDAADASSVAIWYKPNCGASETAPTFSIPATGFGMRAQLAEFSGIPTTGALEQLGTATGTASPLTVNAGSSDQQVGNLIVTAYAWNLTGATTVTLTDPYVNGTSINLGSDAATNTQSHADFAYAVTTVFTQAKILQLTNFLGLEAVTSGTANSTTLARGLVTSIYSNDQNSAINVLRKARGTFGAGTTVLNGDTIGAIVSQAYDGTRWVWNGLLGFGVNGTVSGGVIPADFTITLGSNPGSFYRALWLQPDKSTTIPGALSVPASAGGTPAQSSYGTVPVKIVESLLAAVAGTITFSSIPTGFRDLSLEGIARTDNAATNVDLKIQFNGDTGTNYYSHVLVMDTAVAPVDVQLTANANGEIGTIPGANETANFFGIFSVDINYYQTAQKKNWTYSGGYNVLATAHTRSGQGMWNSTSAINQIVVLAAAGNCIVDSLFVLWGKP